MASWIGWRGFRVDIAFASHQIRLLFPTRSLSSLPQATIALQQTSLGRCDVRRVPFHGFLEVVRDSFDVLMLAIFYIICRTTLAVEYNWAHTSFDGQMHPIPAGLGKHETPAPAKRSRQFQYGNPIYCGLAVMVALTHAGFQVVRFNALSLD